MVNQRQKHPEDRLYHPSQELLNRPRSHPVLGELFPVHAGFFPVARGHYIERPRGFHSHQLLFCLSGKGWIRQGARLQAVAPGHLFLANADEAYTYATDDREPWTLLWIHFSGSAVKTCLDWIAYEPSRTVWPIDPERGEKIRSELSWILDGFLEPWSDVKLLEFAFRLRKIFLTIAEWKAVQNALHPNRDLERVLAYFQENLRGTLSLSQISRKVGLSESQLFTVFRQDLGESPLKYFIRLKLERAAGELKTQNRPVREIASSWGFEDPYYFSRIFKKTFGVTPGQWRKSDGSGAAF